MGQKTTYFGFPKIKYTNVKFLESKIFLKGSDVDDIID